VGVGLHPTQCRLLLRAKWYLDPPSRMATIDMGRNWGLLCPFWGELGPNLTQCPLGLPPYHTKWNLDLSSRLATTDMGRKLGAVRDPFEGSWVPI